MIEKDIISRASQIVNGYLEAMEQDGVGVTFMDRSELVDISAALAIAGVMCRANGMD